MDVVIEYPFAPSLPIVMGKSPRLYLAEGVVAVIEVKSDISNQWDEVLKTANGLSKLERNYGTGISFGPRAGKRIPFYAVSYSGWGNFSKIQEHLKENEFVNGILIIEHGHFSGMYKYLDPDNKEQEFRYESESSAMALWGLISCIHHAASMVTSTTKDIPRRYDKA